MVMIVENMVINLDIIIMFIMDFYRAVYDVLLVSGQLMVDGTHAVIRTMDYGRFQLLIALEKYNNVLTLLWWKMAIWIAKHLLSMTTLVMVTDMGIDQRETMK